MEITQYFEYNNQQRNKWFLNELRIDAYGLQWFVIGYTERYMAESNKNQLNQNKKHIENEEKNYNNNMIQNLLHKKHGKRREQMVNQIESIGFNMDLAYITEMLLIDTTVCI